MKVIIAGSLTIEDHDLLEQAARDSGFDITEVVCGCAAGVDSLGGHCHDELLGLWIKAEDCDKAELGMIHCWACRHIVPVNHFPADWNNLGRGAGPIRNKQMAEYGESLIALWDGLSRGTANMMKQAKNMGLDIYVTWPRKE